MAASGEKAKPRRRRRPLYHSAKISEYRFRKVLWHFVRDHSASETARATGLSVNSVHAIFRKIRVYFWEVGLFRDFYEGVDPLEFVGDEQATEYEVLGYHLQRHREKHGFRSPTSEPPYHFAETYWRYHYLVMIRERPSDTIYDMMPSHLIEMIRLCGPVGTKPGNFRAGLRVILRQMDQRMAWLERNAPGYTDSHQRATLREIQDISIRKSSIK